MRFRFAPIPATRRTLIKTWSRLVKAIPDPQPLGGWAARERFTTAASSAKLGTGIKRLELTDEQVTLGGPQR